MRIRRATGTDAPALSALALRSKAHWGYSAELLSLWSGELEISADFIHQNPVFVAESACRGLGWSATVVHGEVAELEHLRLLATSKVAYRLDISRLQTVVGPDRQVELVHTLHKHSPHSLNLGIDLFFLDDWLRFGVDLDK